MPAQFAIVLPSASAVPAGHDGGDAPGPDAGSLLAQAATGPGFWEDLLGELRRGEFPASEIAALYAERWQIEIAFLHLKKTVKGTGRTLRGRSVTLARQEAWALLLIHNMTATIAARAAGQAGIDPRLIPFTAVLALIRGHVTADTCCPHCGKRPASGNDPIALLVSQVLALPARRDRPARTSGRTAFQRQNWHTEEVAYTITIAPSNLPKADIRPGS